MKRIVFIIIIVFGLITATAVVKKDFLLGIRTRILGQGFDAEIKNKLWQEYEYDCKEPKPCKDYHYFISLGWNTSEGQAGASVKVSNTYFDSVREGQRMPVIVYNKHVIFK